MIVAEQHTWIIRVSHKRGGMSCLPRAARLAPMMDAIAWIHAPRTLLVGPPRVRREARLPSAALSTRLKLNHLSVRLHESTEDCAEMLTVFSHRCCCVLNQSCSCRVRRMESRDRKHSTAPFLKCSSPCLTTLVVIQLH